MASTLQPWPALLLAWLCILSIAGSSAVLYSYIRSYYRPWCQICSSGQSTDWPATKLIRWIHWEEDLLWHTQHLTVWHELQVVWTVCRELLWSSVCYILFWGDRSVHLWQWRQHSVCASRGWPTEQLWATRYDSMLDNSWVTAHSCYNSAWAGANGGEIQIAMKNSWAMGKGQWKEKRSIGVAWLGLELPTTGLRVKVLTFSHLVVSEAK